MNDTYVTLQSVLGKKHRTTTVAGAGLDSLRISLLLYDRSLVIQTWTQPTTNSIHQLLIEWKTKRYILIKIIPLKS